MTSGARYHLVATYSVSVPVWSKSGSAMRERPKSQILKEKVVLRLRESRNLRHLSPEVAVGVEEEVRGLEVAVEHVGRVDVLQSPVKKGACRKR